MPSALGPDGQRATIAKLIHDELEAECKSVDLYRQQGSHQIDLLRQQQTAATESKYTRRLESL